MIAIGGMDVLQETLRTAFDQFVNVRLQAVPDAPKLTPDQVEEVTSLAVLLFPGATAAWLMLSLIFALWLAGRVTLASGRLARPWPDLAAISFPPDNAAAAGGGDGGELLRRHRRLHRPRLLVPAVFRLRAAGPLPSSIS
ncbi:MAG: hypothetical protein WDN31_21810 [Hyphomicrobium sp.]